MSEEQERTYPFLMKPRQFLGAPLAIAPPRTHSVSAAVQFVIRGLHIGKDGEEFRDLVKYCGLDVHSIAFDQVSSQNADHKHTRTCIAFYLPAGKSGEELKAQIDNYARLLIERFVGILTFVSGVGFAVHAAQTSHVSESGSISTSLEVERFTDLSKVESKIPREPFPSLPITDEVYSAFFWLRRGLAARDCLETFSSLMVCLQTLARAVCDSNPVERKCKECGATLESSLPSITSLVRDLVVDRLGEPLDTFEQLWKARNAVVAHDHQC